MYYHRLNRILALFLSLCVVTLATAAEQQQQEKIRVLVVTGGHAFEEQQFYGMFDAISDITTHEATYPAVAESLTPDLADKFDVVVFYDMWAQGITPQQQKAFTALLERGIGVVALHHTMAAHQNWPEYAKIIGGKFHLQDRIDGREDPRQIRVRPWSGYQGPDRQRRSPDHERPERL